MLFADVLVANEYPPLPGDNGPLPQPRRSQTCLDRLPGPFPSVIFSGKKPFDP